MHHYHHQKAYSNAAGGPLPAIPRRTSTSTSTSRPTVPNKRAPKVPGRQRSKRSGSSSSDSDNNSGQSSPPPNQGPPLSLRARRARGPNPPNFPDPLTTAALIAAPIQPDSSDGLRASKTEDNITLSDQRKPPASLIYVPGMPLRLAVDPLGRKSANDGSKSAPTHAVDDSRLIRKKSGQLVKSSLKTSRSTGDGFSRLSSSKSEPATPICKAVHFDAQLEHVKLFLAEQKPLAVSRDGSPTDTSGTDSDFPSFIFGESETQRMRHRLIIDIVNMPPQINPHTNVSLQNLSISIDNSSILGSVLVRNIAYAKSVAVRFTFDSWQTTSEVAGKYTESVNPEFDRFAFVIKLTDLLARIEEKTLILAVRYFVANQEFWDNNNTLDYVAKFIKSAKDRSLSDEEDSSSNLASLQNKLEQVVQGSERTGPAFLAQNTRASVEQIDPEVPTFKSTSWLASRYDFGTSFKNPWKYQETPPAHHRHNSFPQFGKPTSNPSNTPLPTKITTSKPSALPIKPSLGSPRDLSDEVVPISVKSHDETPFPHPTRPETHSRNHRRGYFDLSPFSATNVKRTPPTSPPSVFVPQRIASTDSLDLSDSLSFGPRLYSFPSEESQLKPNSALLPPPLSGGPGSVLGMVPFGLLPDNGFDSEISTPMLITPSSSRDTTPSPTARCAELPSGSDSDGPQNPETHYRDLINQYCFFTGTSGPNAKPPASALAKDGLYDFAGSTRFSSDELMKTPRSGSGFDSSVPQRSSSADDIVSMRSGSLTPTLSRPDLRILSDSESRSATPVPFAI